MLNQVITDADFRSCEPRRLPTVDRYAARGVLIDSQNRVAMMYLRDAKVYKLAGGGMEEGETAEEAFRREVYDETGFSCEILSNLGYVEEHKYQNKYFQYSHCFLARTVGEGGKQQLSTKEKELGFQLKWLPIGDALQIMHQSLKTCENYSMKFMLLRDLTILKYAYRKVLVK